MDGYPPVNFGPPLKYASARSGVQIDGVETTMSSGPTTQQGVDDCLEAGGLVIASMELVPSPLPNYQAWHMLTLVAKSGSFYQVWDPATGHGCGFVTWTELDQTGLDYVSGQRLQPHQNRHMLFLSRSDLESNAIMLTAMKCKFVVLRGRRKIDSTRREAVQTQTLVLRTFPMLFDPTKQMATVSEVARLFDVDRDTVMRWTIEFAEYLSLRANPKKGDERHFTEPDLRVLAVIAEQSEMDCEADDIQYALNSGRQYEKPLLDFARLHSPLFREPSEEMDETWQHGVLVGGMACRDLPHVARAYKLAADELMKQAVDSCEPHELDYPILFLYRHTVELYLKAALANPPQHHDLCRLIQLLEAECGNKLARWIRDRLWDFHTIDRMSAVFRYADPPPDGELWIDFHQLQIVVDRIVCAIEQYIATRSGTGDYPLAGLFMPGCVCGIQ